MKLADKPIYARSAFLTELEATRMQPASVSNFSNYEEPGMTLLEYYAGLAMQGVIASGDAGIPEATATYAVKQAKALIAALEVLEAEGGEK